MAGFTLLYAEDDIEALEDTKFLLKREFSEIYIASDGQKALEHYKTHKPDVILLDINMPKLTGLQVATKIKQIDNNAQIIFLTAYSQSENLLDAIKIGTSSYLVKPFKVQELKDAIKKITSTLKPKVVNDGKISLTNDFFWNQNSFELFYKDRPLVITKNEMELIKLLVSNRNRFYEAHEVALYLGKENDSIGHNNIVQLISRFKKKILKQLEVEEFFIESIYGRGYRIK